MSDFICDCATTGLSILPVRYAVVPKSVKQQLPAWANHGWAKTKGFKAELDEEQYHYALRVLRQGFIYLYLSEMEGDEKWRVFSIAKDGSLWKQKSAKAAKLKDRSDCSTPGHQSIRTEFFCISEPEKCGRIWIAYSEHKWTDNTLEKYAKDPSVRMREIKPSDWNVPADTDDIARATEENINSILDYCPNFHYYNLPDINYGIPVPYESLIKEDDWKEKYKIYKKKFNVSSDEKDSYSYRREMVELQTTEHPFIYTRRGNAGKTYNSMCLYSEGVIKPLIIALDDPIGIAHELNSFFNEAAGKLASYTEERAYQYTAWSYITSAKDLIKNAESEKDRINAESAKTSEGKIRLENYRKTKIEWKAAFLERHTDPNLFEELDRVTYMIPYGDDEVTYQRDFLSLQVTAKRYIEAHKRHGVNKTELTGIDPWDKYQKKLDKTGLFNKFDRQFNELSELVDTIRERRVIELLKWIKDDLFELILDDYDKKDSEVTGRRIEEELSDGVEFVEVINSVLEGINSTAKGKKLIEEWMDDLSDNNKNYVKRALAYNQQEVKEEINKIFKIRKDGLTSKGLDKITDSEIESMIASIQFKKIADIYKKAQGYVNAQARAYDFIKNNNTKYATKLYANWRPLKYISDRLLMGVGQGLFFSSYGKVDKAAEMVVKSFLYIRSGISIKAMGELVRTELMEYNRNEKILLDKLLKGIDKVNSERGKLFKTLENAFNEIGDEQSNRSNPINVTNRGKMANVPARNAVIDVRLALLVGILEIFSLAKTRDMAKNEPNNEDIQNKLTIAYFATFGAMTEVFAQSAKLVAGDASPWFQVAKVGGATLGMVAGIMNGVLDWKKANLKDDKGELSIACLYWSRSVLQFSSAIFGFATSLTYCTGFLETYLLRKSAEKIITKAIGDQIARVLILRSVLMGIGIYVSLAIIIISIIIYLVEDDELEDWLERSAFGDMNSRSNGYNFDIKKQTQEFELAIGKILGVQTVIEEEKSGSKTKIEIPVPYNDY